MIVRRTCSRCNAWLWMTKEECEHNPRQVICTDCDYHLRANPEMAQREFAAELRRADMDSVAMRARWAAHDAAKKGVAV